jgi:hypothetical protein
MTIKSYTEQLESVQAAIEAVEAGQEYTIGNRTWRGADLKTLYDREQRLMPLVARENNGGGIRVRNIIPCP